MRKLQAIGLFQTHFGLLNEKELELDAVPFEPQDLGELISLIDSRKHKY